MLSIRLPLKIANSFAFSFSEDFILIMGGITKKETMAMNTQNPYLNVAGGTQQDLNKTYEVQNRVYVLKIGDKDTKFKWKQLAPFPFKKKVGNIVYNNYGKFFCFVIENNNRELPQLVVYDVRRVFPQFDRYYATDQE